MKVFETEQHEKFRVVDRKGDPWFVLNEVCAELGISNVSDAASRLDDDEKASIFMENAKSQSRKVIIINEPGLYSLIMGSKKPEAKKFKKWVTTEVLPQIRKTGGYSSKVPAFISRSNQNWDRVSSGHFSVINELTIRLWGRLERLGHILADEAPDGKQIRPDNSVGTLFAKYLRKEHPSLANQFGLYLHTTPEWEGDVREYPVEMWPIFIRFVDEVWIPEHSERYFKRRDPAVLPYLTMLLPSPASMRRVA
jgi:prophage antirepressor-like protein